jgi:DNA-binding Lrp family transcriptional regulator
LVPRLEQLEWKNRRLQEILKGVCCVNEQTDTNGWWHLDCLLINDRSTLATTALFDCAGLTDQEQEAIPIEGEAATAGTDAGARCSVSVTMKVEHEGDQVLSFSEALSTADEYEECEKRAEDEGATAENFSEDEEATAEDSSEDEYEHACRKRAEHERAVAAATKAARAAELAAKMAEDEHAECEKRAEDKKRADLNDFEHYVNGGPE